MDALLATAFISLGAQPPPAGTGWTAVVSKGRYGTFDGSSTSFNAVLTAAMNMGVPVIRRDCAGCDVEHKSIFYRRLTPVPSKFSLFECIKNNWTIKSSNSNAFNVDFELYSALDDALAGNSEKRWTFCNGDDVSGVGFPRDCGRTVQAVDQWNSFSGRGGQPDVLFAIAASKTPGPPAPQPPAPTPAPPSRFCPMYHPIHASDVYDPSGPLLDDAGVWHTWEDAGSWSHWTSPDLVHWTGSFTENTTHFGGDTGSVSPTPSGVYAFWPIMSGTGKGSIGSAKATDASLTSWTHRGPTIPMPARINTGYRDPVRAFEHPAGSDRWWQGVGCGSKEEGAQFCLFEAKDNTLMEFTDRGSLYTTNVTYGEVDGNIVWQPTNVSANMMECPDLFPLNAKESTAAAGENNDATTTTWVLIGSLYKTNQWWVGTLSGDPPRFTPDNVGILDYGNGYAAKTGSTMKQGPTTRRVVFGFTGWSEPTEANGCGRSLILPRDLSVTTFGGTAPPSLAVDVVPETAVLRVPGSATFAEGTRATAVSLVSGSQVEIRVNCSWPGGAPASGKLAIRTLGGAKNRSIFLEIGVEFGSDASFFYADHSACCGNKAIVQRAPLPATATRPPSDGGGAELDLAVFVDGGLVEAFASGFAITPLVNPDEVKGGAPDERTSVVMETIGRAAMEGCEVRSWKLAY